MRSNHPVLLLLAAVFSACATDLVAQRLAETYTPNHLPRAWARFESHSDFDGDGRTDILRLFDFRVGPSGGAGLTLSTGDASGVFSAFRSVSAPSGFGRPGTGPWTLGMEGVPAGDVDGDGDVDILYLEQNISAQNTLISSVVRVGWNDGTGNFPTSSVVTPADDWRYAALADLDGDGDADIATMNSELSRTPIATVWRSDPGQVFTQLQSLPAGGIGRARLHLADHDGDGDVDLLANHVYDNDGSAQFTDVTGTRMPPGVPRGPYVFADFDGDGDVDAAMPTQVQLDAGNGTLSASQFLVNLGSFNEIETLDADSDGDLDLVLSSIDELKLLLNNGAGRFLDAGPAAFPSNTSDTGWITVDDVDADGDDDLITTSRRNGAIYLSTGQGRFVDGTPRLLENSIQFYESTDFADLNNDGVVDALVRAGGSLDTYLGDGFGDFAATPVRTTIIGLNGGAGFDRVLADFDGDGNVDLVDGWQVFQGDGTGAFSLVVSFALSGSQVAVSDFDLDGDLDLSFAQALLRNDGGFAFTMLSSATSAGSFVFETDRLAIDVDGDGDDDVLIGTLSAADRVFLNDGTGGFTLAPAGQWPGTTTDVVRMTRLDLDADGDQDVLMGCRDPLGGSLRMDALVNDGAGRFTVQTQSVFGSVPAASEAHAADLDLDGDLDVVTSAGEFHVFEATPSGLVDRTTSWLDPALSIVPEGLALADVDDDGDADLITQRRRQAPTNRPSEGPAVLHNRRRQWSGANVGQAGSGMQFVAHAEGPGDSVIPFVSPLPLQPQVDSPWGPLRVNAGIAIVLASQPASLGSPARWTLPIPSDPGLVGLTLFSQALFVPSNSAMPWRLSNAIARPIVE